MIPYCFVVRGSRISWHDVTRRRKHRVTRSVSKKNHKHKRDKRVGKQRGISIARISRERQRQAWRYGVKSSATIMGDRRRGGMASQQ